MRDGGATRDGGSATRWDAATSQQREREAETLADKIPRCNEKVSADAMGAGSNNNNKSSWRQSKNHFKGSVEGGLREVTRKFCGQPLRGGSYKVLDTVVVALLSHFL
jgi:hypothetical protein